MVKAADAFFILLSEFLKIQAFNQNINPTRRINCYIPINSSRKKYRLVVNVRMKMYLCHIYMNLMPKETKFLGYNKAPIYGSRDFVLKKKVCFVTHPLEML